ncbi:MAG: hypothetical protein ACKOPT_04825 [Cyanobium sp.]|nr:hypothetical protein [Cyanobacteriota bacterium]
MAESPYLVALALLDLGGKRALPLAGRSLPASAAEASDPGDAGRTLALELLLRLWQRSDEGPLQRAAGENSLLLVEIPLDLMSDQLPLLKANWIAEGDTAEFLEKLAGLAGRGWRIVFTKYEPVGYERWLP